jgi:type II secretory pathway pseudopilin PulG
MKNRGFTMISTLITVAIICILMVVMMQGYSGVAGGQGKPTRKDGRGTTTMGGAIVTAQDQVCKSNLQQVRQAIEAAKLSGSDELPPDIKSAGIGESFYSCPLGNEAYKYDSMTGRVQCVHPGHERY